MQTQKSIFVVDEAHHLKNELADCIVRSRASRATTVCCSPARRSRTTSTSCGPVLHFLLPDFFTSADAFDEAVDVANHRVDAERLESARQLLGHFMLRRTKEVVGLPRKYETLVPCPLAPLQASWYKRLLASDTATASVLTVSQLKTLIMQLRKICNHPRTLLGSAKDSAAAAAAGAAAAAAVSSSSSSKAPMGGGGKRGERLRQELAALTGEELMQASGKLLVLDRLLERLFQLESRALIFSTFTQVMSADGH